MDFKNFYNLIQMLENQRGELYGPTEPYGPPEPEKYGPPTPAGYFEKPDVESFLQKIGQIESSGGKNLQHKVMEEGIHAGSSAIGRYGIMPNTLNDIIKVAQRDKQQISPELSGLYNADSATLSEKFKQNPEIEKEAASLLAQRVLERYQDPEKAAYAWNQGHYQKPENITPEKLGQTDYVKKFRELSSQLGNR